MLLERATYCAECRIELQHEAPDTERQPCPICGEKARAHVVRLHEVVRVEDRVTWRQTRYGASSKAVLDQSGSIQFSAQGPAPQNETGARNACARLVEWLNSQGEDWNIPVPGEMDVDFFSTHCADRRRHLRMQVVRASGDEAMWRALNVDGHIDLEFDADSAADELMRVIATKAARYAEAQRRILTLVIDAGTLIGHTYVPVFRSFRLRHSDASRRAGFSSIWAVGPSSDLVTQLT